MSDAVGWYSQVLEARFSTETTIFVVVGPAWEEIARVLGADPTRVSTSDPVDEKTTRWSFLALDGGVLAVEYTGYGDPTLAALRELSAGGGACAVVRGNVQGHDRFGCARDGEVLFDDDEYIYIDDPDVVPPELRPLFDLVWDDLDDEEGDEDTPDPFAVGLAMAELITGLRISGSQIEQAYAGPWYDAPALLYPDQS